MNRIKSIVEANTIWLTSYESEIIQEMKGAIQKRYEIEVSVIHRLTEMIGDVIMSNEPIREEWLLAPDALAIVSNRHVYPEEPDPIEPALDPYYSDRLNNEQVQVLKSWLDNMRVGDYIIEQDLNDMLDRCLASTGPFSSISQTFYPSNINQKFLHLTMPTAWRMPLPLDPGNDGVSIDANNTVDRIRSHLMERGACHPGTDEHTGIYPCDDVIRRLTTDTMEG